MQIEDNVVIVYKKIAWFNVYFNVYFITIYINSN